MRSRKTLCASSSGHRWKAAAPSSRDPDRANWKLRACASYPPTLRELSGATNYKSTKRILSSYQVFKKPEVFSQTSHPRTILISNTRSPISHKCPWRSCKVSLELYIKRRGRRDRDGRTHWFEPNENVSNCFKKGDSSAARQPVV